MQQPANTQSEEEYLPTSMPGMQPSSDMGAAQADFLKWTWDGLQRLIEIKHRLKGEELVEVKPDYFEWEEQEGRRFMNDRGVNKIVFLIEPFFAKEMITASISYEECHNITEATMQELKNTIAENSEEWNMDESLYIDMVLYLDNQIYLALTRVKEGASGGASKIIKPVVRRVETYGQQPAKKSGGFLGMFGKK